MKSVVVVTPGEVVRIVALAVMARPENAGRACTMVVPEQSSSGAPAEVPAVHVVMFDTQEEAKAGMAGVEAMLHPPAVKAPVLQLVQPAAAFGVNDKVRLKSGGPIMRVHAIESGTGDIFCHWPDDIQGERAAFFVAAALEKLPA